VPSKAFDNGLTIAHQITEDCAFESRQEIAKSIEGWLVLSNLSKTSLSQTKLVSPDLNKQISDPDELGSSNGSSLADVRFVEVKEEEIGTGWRHSANKMKQTRSSKHIHTETSSKNLN